MSRPPLAHLLLAGILVSAATAASAPTASAAGTVTVTVVSKSTGHPVAGAYVGANAGGNTPRPDDTKTNARGQVVFHLAAQKWGIYVAGVPTKYLEPNWNRVADLGKHPSVSYRVELSLGGSISGTITDAVTGNPALNVCASVGLYPLDANNTYSGPKANKGRYVDSQLRPGKYIVGATACDVTQTGFIYAPSYWPQGHLAGLGKPVTVRSGKTTAHIDLTVDRVGEISGTILDSSGAPVPDHCVQITNPQADLAESGSGLEGSQGVHTDSNGHFTTMEPPGTEYVGATTDQVGYDVSACSGATFWFNGTTDFAAATPLTIQSSVVTPVTITTPPGFFQQRGR